MSQPRANRRTVRSIKMPRRLLGNDMHQSPKRAVEGIEAQRLSAVKQDFAAIYRPLFQRRCTIVALKRPFGLSSAQNAPKVISTEQSIPILQRRKTDRTRKEKPPRNKSGSGLLTINFAKT